LPKTQAHKASEAQNRKNRYPPVKPERSLHTTSFIYAQFPTLGTYTPLSGFKASTMVFKFIVIILFIANIVALGVALRALLTNQTDSSGKTVKYLTVRVLLAVALLAFVGVGLLTGQLGASAPWLSY
jgi:hypothetical protein